MTPSCYSCKRVLEVGESAWADDWTVIDLDHKTPRVETRYTCDDCADPTPCCPDPGCAGPPCTFPGYAENH